jgi:predicted transcriptional regulator
MIKYAKIINEETKQCEVGIGTNAEYYKSIGMTEMEVEQAYTGDWYVAGFAPEEPAPTKEEQSEKRAEAYRAEVDPITSHISRLRDAEQTEEITAEIAELIAERDAKVEEIKERYPYPTDPITEQGE